MRILKKETNNDMETENLRCIIFCRVSSKEQEETGYSLPAQEKYLKEYCEKKEIAVVKIFKISESASGEKQRDKFTEMMNYGKKENIKIIVCEKADRLTRNFKDMVAIDQWLDDDNERQVHLVKDSLIMHRDSKSQEKLNWGIRILFAKNYIDNLSEEVKKGQKAKIEEGWLPTKPPVGYRTIGEKGHKIHVIDEKVAPYIKQMFNHYSTGNYSLKKLSDELYDKGLRSIGNKRVGKSIMHRLLTDPFYCGKMRWKGKIYDAQHEPIITEILFNKVGKVIKRPLGEAPHYRKHMPLFKGKLKCGECGGTITWDKQKGTWYGHCNHHKPCSQRKYIRQEDLEAMLLPLFDKVSPSNERVLMWLEKSLKDSGVDQTEYTENKRKILNAELAKVEQRIEAIYEDKIDRTITVEFYNKKYEEYDNARKDILKNLKALDDSKEKYRKTAIAIHELAFNAKRIFLNHENTMEAKRKILSDIFSNFELKDLKIKEKYTPAFQFLLEWMPKLNKIFEQQEKGLNKTKTDPCESARSELLRGWDSDPRPID